MPGVQVFVLIVVEFGQPGLFAFAGDGAEEMGDGFEFSGIAEVDVFDYSGFGKEVEEDEDLFFGEDVFLFAFGWWWWGLFFDDRVDVEFVFGEGGVVLMILLDFEVDIGEWGIRKECGVADLLGGIEEGFVKIGLRGDEEGLEDLGSFVEKGTVDAFDLEVTAFIG